MNTEWKEIPKECDYQLDINKKDKFLITKGMISGWNLRFVSAEYPYTLILGNFWTLDEAKSYAIDYLKHGLKEAIKKKFQLAD